MPRASRLVPWLSLAASPTFAALALVAARDEGGATEMLCGGSGGIPLGGMTTMYALMSVFHLAPWLRLAAGRVFREG
jgi:hypothetical protein